MTAKLVGDKMVLDGVPFPASWFDNDVSPADRPSAYPKGFTADMLAKLALEVMADVTAQASPDTVNKAYNEDQPRDERGRWGEGGSGGAKAEPGKPVVEPTQQGHALGDGSMKDILTMQAELEGPHLPEGVKYGHAGFVVANGQQYPFGWESFQGTETDAHKCYMNAGRAALADSNLTYVEGYVSVGGVPVAHAWNVDSSGRVMDPTLTPRSASHIKDYFGVPFSSEYLSTRAMKTKVWGLLGDIGMDQGLLTGKTKNFKGGA